jgi:DNA-binding MarR family transcriptional regulator
MKIEGFDISEDIYQKIIGYIDEIKDLLSSDIWENIFVNLSKNEILIFWLLYLKQRVNMTEIAEYIHVPLNTATGIVSRMEKDGLVERTRSAEDKRVVLIVQAEKGKQQFQKLFVKMLHYGTKIFDTFTDAEIELFFKMMDKVKGVLQEDKKEETAPKKVRKITIE